MTRATKKELNEVLKPLYKAYDRYALGFTTGGTAVEKPQALEWRGLKIDIQLVRRSKILTGVPFPQAVIEFHYRAFKDNRLVTQWTGRPSFIDAVFRIMKDELNAS